MTHFITDHTALFTAKADLTALPGGADATKYAVAADINLLRQALLDIQDYLGGNATITNLDPTSPDLVRYNFYPLSGALGGAAETTAMYGRLGTGFGASEFQYVLYAEIPSTQNYTSSGCAIKVLHDGHGDGMYVAMLNGISAKTITAMTGNGVPIVCTIVNHGFGQGDVAQITGCLGNTAANGTWYGITIIDANTFSLPASTGNGTYTASSGTAQDINSPVGYEAAAYGDGTTGFLSSMQYAGGRANWQGFTALYQQNTLLNYSAFQALGVPNHAFSVTKQPGLADTALDGLTQYQVLEASPRMVSGNGVGSGNYRGGWDPAATYVLHDTVTYGLACYACVLTSTNNVPPNGTYWSDVTDAVNNNRIRIGLFNNGDAIQSALCSTAATTTHDSPEHRLRSTYYAAAASHDLDAVFKVHVSAVTPTADLRMYLGAAASPQLLAIWSPHSGGGGDLDLQVGAISNVTSITGTLVNLQTSGAQFDHYVNGTIHMELAAAADGETALLVRRNVGAAFTLQRVSMGIADSGGAGFKVLRVPN